MIRHAARLIVLDQRDRILLVEVQTPQGDKRMWITPGGGLDEGEAHIDAARRELYEETGLQPPIGPCVWTRRHEFVWDGQPFDQRERFFVVRVVNAAIRPLAPDPYTIAHRWWTPGEILASTERFAPRRLGVLLPPIIAGAYPDAPIDVGV